MVEILGRARTKKKKTRKFLFAVSSSKALRSFLEVEKNNTLQKEGISFHSVQ